MCLTPLFQTGPAQLAQPGRAASMQSMFSSLLCYQLALEPTFVSSHVASINESQYHRCHHASVLRDSVTTNIVWSMVSHKSQSAEAASLRERPIQLPRRL